MKAKKDCSQLSKPRYHKELEEGDKIKPIWWRGALKISHNYCYSVTD